MNPQADRPPYSESCKDTEKLCYGQSHHSGGTVSEVPPPWQQAEPTASAVPGMAGTEEGSINTPGLKQPTSVTENYPCVQVQEENQG